MPSKPPDAPSGSAFLRMNVTSPGRKAARSTAFIRLKKNATRR